VVGYRIYYGTTSHTYLQPKGSGIDAVVATTYIIRGLQSGTTYFFAVTDYDASGNESGYSAEVSKTVQ
jgi:hypothetical protein